LKRSDDYTVKAAGTIFLEAARDKRGFSLVEILVTLAIFSIIIAGVFSAFTSQMKNTTREYKLAQTDLEFGVARGILERDIHMAGYGLADDYGTLAFNPKAYQGTNGAGSNPDELKMMGTALGIMSRQAQGWTYVRTADASETSPVFQNWTDSREVIGRNDRAVLMEPSARRLLTQGGQWLYKYDFKYAADPSTEVADAQRLTTLTGGVTSNPAVGTVIYALSGVPDDPSDEATQPYYAVRYYLGGASPHVCAPGTQSLLRAESVTTEDPSGSGVAQPILSCVRDFQVAFGLDRDEDGTIETWDHGGVTYISPDPPATPYTRVNQRKRLKQVRVQILVQSGSRDPDYTYPSNTITMGDPDRTVTLTDAQKKYRWKLITMNLTPRNLR
jgi:prepilin-type N-terminal cleavage/methylation domain-containing protein